MPKTKICSQGEYDGACFLYSITNGYISLTGKRPTYNMWNKALINVPFKEDFILNIGTLRYDDNMDLYIHAAERILKTFSRGKMSLKIKPFADIKSSKDLYQLINNKSVLIFCYHGEHWVVAVDIDDKYLYLADSFKLVKVGLKYWEKVCPKYKRYYNNIIKLIPFDWFYNPSAIQIIKK